MLALFAAALAWASIPAPPVRAAPGDNLASFDAQVTGPIPACGGVGTGLGIAFDGTLLYLSCINSNVLQRINASTHASAGPITISGLSNIGALSYDPTAGGNKIWACEDFGDVYLIDLSTNTATFKFATPGAGCPDGLAFDAEPPGSVWAGSDQSDTLTRYSLTGTVLASYTGVVAKLGGYGRSGIAVGSDTIYLDNQDGHQIYRCDKGLVSCTLTVATTPSHIEDMECDTATFPGKHAIWVRNAYDQILNAWEIPAVGSCSAASPLSCTPGGVDIGTGQSLVPDSGNPDLLWSAVSGPTIGPAYPVTKPVAWVAPPSPTNWIDPNNTNGLTGDPAGDYEFEAIFSAPAGTTTLTLDFDFAVDNNIVIELDGVPIPGATLTGGGSGNFTALHSPANYVLTGAAAAGQHTLTATVGNDDGPVGFLLDGTATCTGGTQPCAVTDLGAGVSAHSAQCRTVDVRICYGGAAPTGGVLGCNGGSENVVPASTVLTQYTLQNMPVGHRLPDCGAHFVRDLNCGRSLSVTYSPSPWGYSTPVGNWGDIYGVADVACNIISDVLAGFGGPGGGVGGWPNPTTWAPYTTSQVVTPTWMNNGDSRLVPPSFTVLGTEQATGTNVWVGGFAPLTMPSPYPWTITTAQSPYPSASGLKLTWNVIGDPLKPPHVSDLCVDSRWAHVHMNNAQWTSPAAPGLYPRWTIVQTMQDIRSGIIHRTVDLHCVGVAPVPPDADADCLADSIDTNDANQDQDGDLLVDGIDVANGSNPAAADTDADGASDFDELFTFTDPTDSDTDNDGQADRLDLIAISGAGNTGDATDLTDDNCPALANVSQLNTDSLEYVGGGAHYGDRTQPQQDWMGDLCDRDMDNDHLYNVTEAAFLMSGLNCFNGTGATTNALKADHDLSMPFSPNGADQAVDGAECSLGANPLTHQTTFVACNATTDGDVDRLCYHPNGVGGNASRENFWRTRDISGFPGELEHGCAPPPRIPGCIDTFIGETDRDSDGDGLPDGTEVKYYATNPSNADTDSDSCPDGKEVADINGDGNTNSGDQGLLATIITNPLPAWDPIRIARDMTKDGFVNSGDQGFLASFISLGGGACPARTGIVVTRSRQ